MKVDDIVHFLNVVKDIALICLIATKDASQKLALFSPSPWDPKLARCIFSKFEVGGTPPPPKFVLSRSFYFFSN
jgi:hypothetical protein